MAKTLEELETEFGGAAPGKATTSSPTTLEELEKQFAPVAATTRKSGASEIPGGEGAIVGKEAPPSMFEPGLVGGMQKGLAQIGSGMANIPLGVRQMLGKTAPGEVEEKRRIDAALNAGPMGTINNFAGQVAPALAAPAGIGGGLPALLTYNALVGGVQGATEPTGEGESRPMNTALGMVGGAAGPGVARVIGNMLRPAAGEASELVKKALDMGIPLGPGDVTQSGTLKAIKSLLGDLPFTGGMAKQHADDVANAITGQVGKTAGITGPLDAGAILARKRALGAEFDSHWKNPIEYDANLFGGLQQLESRLDELSPGVATKFKKDIGKLYDSVYDANGTLMIPGQLMDSIQKGLGPIIGAKGEASDVARQFQKEILGAFERSAPAGSRDALGQTKSQWKALTKVIEPLMNSAEAGVAGREAGQVPLGLLSNKVQTAYPNVATSPFKDIAPIAGRFGVDRTPRTGGSMRAMLQNGLTGAALGTGGYMLGTGTPAAAILGMGALAGTAGVGAQKLLSSPSVVRRAMAEPVKQALLSDPELRPALQGLIGTTAARAPATGALTGLSNLTRASQPSALEEE